MDVSISIRADGPTPIYLQIRYQLAHLITSGQLREGHRLPTVRTLADELGVNPGTVAQAYQELQNQGLLEAAPGRGTFVATTLPVRLDSVARQRLLDDAIATALLRARSLGVTDDEIRMHVQLAMTTTASSRHVVFAAPTLAIAGKYAASIERNLGPTVTVIPVTFDAIATRVPYVAALLQTAYFVITFAGFTRAVEGDLTQYASPTRVLGCSTEVQERTFLALQAIGPTERLCLATQEPYVLPTLNLISEQTGRASDAIAVCIDGDTSTATRLFPTVDLVVYTFAAREFVVDQGVPNEKRLEVSFDLTHESLERLANILVPNGVADGERSTTHRRVQTMDESASSL